MQIDSNLDTHKSCLLTCSAVAVAGVVMDSAERHRAREAQLWMNNLQIQMNRGGDGIPPFPKSISSQYILANIRNVLVFYKL